MKCERMQGLAIHGLPCRSNVKVSTFMASNTLDDTSVTAPCNSALPVMLLMALPQVLAYAIRGDVAPSLADSSRCCARTPRDILVAPGPEQHCQSAAQLSGVMWQQVPWQPHPGRHPRSAGRLLRRTLHRCRFAIGKSQMRSGCRLASSPDVGVSANACRLHRHPGRCLHGHAACGIA